MVRAIIIKMKDPEFLPLKEKVVTLSVMAALLGVISMPRREAQLRGSRASYHPSDCEPS